jgi:alpha-galactosidase
MRKQNAGNVFFYLILLIVVGLSLSCEPVDSSISSAGKGADKSASAKGKPYILTPKPSLKPRINGPKVFGVRSGRPFLFTIPATGKRPTTFSAEGLPTGLTLNEKTGRITGRVEVRGTYDVKLQATNVPGSTERNFRIVVGDKIALTPPMGWNSWNCWGCSIDDARIRETADAMVSSGLVNHGWTYVNIDDCWMGKRDTQTGETRANGKFRDMKGLCEYVHSKGLKIGLYTDCGPMTCQQLEGSEGYEAKDILTYAEWGFDYVKIDWCYCEAKEPIASYRKFGDALKECSRDIVFSICNWGKQNPWEWGESVGGNLWRTTDDIRDTWQSVAMIGFGKDTFSGTTHSSLAKFAGPGHWNDPDMLVVGQVGWGPKLHPTQLSPDEQYSHISLWCLMAAPLLIGCDLTNIDEFTLSLLTNDEVLEVDQDPLGKQAERLAKDGPKEVWAKDMEDGSKAVGLFNVGPKETKVKVKWSDIGVKGKQTVRDLWRQKDIGVFDGEFEAKVAGHGVVLVRIIPKSGGK